MHPRQYGVKDEYVIVFFYYFNDVETQRFAAHAVQSR